MTSAPTLANPEADRRARPSTLQQTCGVFFTQLWRRAGATQPQPSRRDRGLHLSWTSATGPRLLSSRLRRVRSRAPRDRRDSALKYQPGQSTASRSPSRASRAAQPTESSGDPAKSTQQAAWRLTISTQSADPGTTRCHAAGNRPQRVTSRPGARLNAWARDAARRPRNRRQPRARHGDPCSRAGVSVRQR